jgi:RNA polymerase-binding transcription factor DksA
MDDIDAAQEYAELYRQDALARHFAGKRDTGHDATRGQEPQDRGTSSAPMSSDPTTDRLCRNCREPIDPARLAANPQAVRCLDCQTETERNQRHGAT